MIAIIEVIVFLEVNLVVDTEREVTIYVLRVFLADDGAVVEERVAVQRVVGSVGQCGVVAELHTETAVWDSLRI